MLTNILKKIATVFNRTACSLEHRANHIDKLETLKAKNKKLKDELEALKTKYKENPTLFPAGGHETDPEEYCLGSYHRTWLQTLTERVDALEKEFDRPRGKHDDCDNAVDLKTEDLAPGEHMVDPGDVFNSAPELTDDDDDDEDEYIDPVERIMSMEPVGQFPPAKGE